MFSNHKSIFSTSSFWLCSLFAIVLIVDPNMAYAAEKTKIEDVLCNVLDLVQGPIGKGIGMVAIIFLGVSLFMGKVSWGLAISTAIGLGFIFGASGIVSAIGGVDKSDCQGTNIG